MHVYRLRLRRALESRENARFPLSQEYTETNNIIKKVFWISVAAHKTNKPLSSTFFIHLNNIYAVVSYCIVRNFEWNNDFNNLLIK